MNAAELKGALEAIIYAADEPATLDRLAGATGAEKNDVRQALDEMIAACGADERGIEIRRVARGYKYSTKPQHHEVVGKFIKSLRPPVRLSMAALETLAVVAYRQPITLPEIQEIRGVNCAGVIQTLLEKRLVTTAGRKSVIGRPILYRTTRDFLVRFGLNDVDELPSLEEFEQMAREALGAEEGIEPGIEVAQGDAGVGEAGSSESPQEEAAAEKGEVPSAGEKVEEETAGEDLAVAETTVPAESEPETRPETEPAAESDAQQPAEEPKPAAHEPAGSSELPQEEVAAENGEIPSAVGQVEEETSATDLAVAEAIVSAQTGPESEPAATESDAQQPPEEPRPAELEPADQSGEAAAEPQAGSSELPQEEAAAEKGEVPSAAEKVEEETAGENLAVAETTVPAQTGPEAEPAATESDAQQPPEEPKPAALEEADQSGESAAEPPAGQEREPWF